MIYLAIIISFLLNFVAFSFPPLRLMALSSFLPAAGTLYEFLSCKPFSLEGWYWANCGLPEVQRIIAALTTPFFTISLFSTILVLVGLKENDKRFFAFSSLSLLSLLFLWSNYLNLNYPLSSPPPRLPPLGFSVLRGQWFFVFYPLLATVAALVLAYFMTLKDIYAKLSTLFSFAVALSSAAHAQAAYGLPLPPDSFHLSLALLPASATLLFHADDNASKLTAFFNVFVAFSLFRLYPLPIGNVPSPYFGIQTSTALVMIAIYVYSLKRALKGPFLDKRFSLHYVSVALLTVASLLDFVDNYLFLNVVTPEALLWAFLAVQLLSALNFSLIVYIKNKDKLGLLGPLMLLAPESATLAPAVLAVIDLFKTKKAFSAIMVLTSVTFAVALLHASWLEARFYQPVGEAKWLGTKTVSTYSYRGNLTAYELISTFEVNDTRYEVKSIVNVFMGKYVPPNEPAFFSWSVPRWEGLGSCAFSLRPLPLGQLRCAPLAAFAYLYPAFGLLTLLLAYILPNKRSSPGGAGEGTELHSV